MLHTAVSPHLHPFSLLGARTRLLPSRLPLPVLMAFIPLLTSPPVFLPLLTWARGGEGASAPVVADQHDGAGLIDLYSTRVCSQI